MAKRRLGNADGSSRNKTLFYVLLLAVAVGVGLYIRAGATESNLPMIPQAYWDTETDSLYIMKTWPLGALPFVNPDTGRATLWEAWTCTNPKCSGRVDGKAPLFPRVIDLSKLKGGVKQPAPGEEPTPQYRNFIEAQLMKRFPCKYCKKSRYTERYRTPEAIKELEELKAKYKK